MKIIFEVTKEEFKEMLDEAEVSKRSELEELLVDDMERIYSEVKIEVRVKIL